MLLAPPAPQRQLHSVALRYRHALAGSGAIARPAQHMLEVVDGNRPAAAMQPGPFCRHEKLARLEATLFIASEPLNARKIAHAASLADATEARTLIRQLNGFYDAQTSAFRVEQVAGGYQLLTRAKFGGWLRRLRQAPVEARLSAPAAETLAVVAYRQPVMRAEIESIRGVQCGEMLRQLMDRNLVRIVGRSPELGRPFLYGTTRRFLQWSGLRSLDELPRADILRHRCEETSAHESNSAARRDDELNPRNDLNEEPEVKIVDRPESELSEPWTPVVAYAEALPFEPWAPAVAPQAHADEAEDVDDDEDDDLDDDDDDDFDDDDDDDLDEEDDLDDEDLEDEEWEEVDDDDDWEDDDEDWDEDDEDEDDDEDWDDE